MQIRFGVLLLITASLGFAQTPDSRLPRAESSRSAAAKSAVSGAQAWRATGSEGAQSLDENALRQSDGSIQQAIEKPASESIKGGGSTDNIMNQLEKELEKQLKDLR